MQLPKLNFGSVDGPGFGTSGLGLNIPSLGATIKTKDKSHNVYLCIPFQINSTTEELNEIQNDIENKFGKGTKLVQISKGPTEEWVIQPPFDNINNANIIPSLSSIDEAYQTIKHVPYIIDNISIQQTNLTKEIDRFTAENDKLQREKQQIEIENSLLLQEIKRLETESQNLTKWGENVKKSFDKMISKL